MVKKPPFLYTLGCRGGVINTNTEQFKHEPIQGYITKGTPQPTANNVTRKNYLEHQPCILKCWIRASYKVSNSFSTCQENRVWTRRKEQLFVLPGAKQSPGIAVF